MHIDFETYSEASLKDCGARKYAQHASTDVWCCAYATNLGPIKIWQPGDSFPQEIADALDVMGESLFAWNASFERAVWEFIMHTAYGWPMPHTTHWGCTQAAALTHGSPKALQHACSYFGIKQEKASNKIMHTLAKPDRKGNRPKPTQAQLEELFEYCKQDVLVERAIHKVCPPMSDYEKRVYALDQEINLTGIPVDTEFAESALDLWDAHGTKLNEDFRDITGLNASQSIKLAQWFNDQGISISNVSQGAIAKLLQQPNLKPEVQMAAELRQQLAGSAVKKYKTILSAAEHDNRIRNTQQYHSASTGRWGGRLFQPQNLPRGILKTHEIDAAYRLVSEGEASLVDFLWQNVNQVLASLVRPTIRVPDNRKLIAVDFSQVESRGVGWIADDENLIKTFTSDVDPYVAMASAIFKTQDIDADKRFIGKQAVLGCGFQLGPPGYQRRLKNDFDVDVSLELAKRAVYSYRDAYPNVPQFWYDVDRAFRNVTKGAKQHVQVRPNLSIHKEGNWVYITLPSSRKLAYRDPRLVPDPRDPQRMQIEFTGVDSASGKPAPELIYGGKITENVVQALCRDLMVNAMFNLRLHGYTIICTIHDEILLECDKDFGSVEEVIKVMTTLPEWAKGFPLAAAGWSGQYYRKD